MRNLVFGVLFVLCFVSGAGFVTSGPVWSAQDPSLVEEFRKIASDKRNRLDVTIDGKAEKLDATIRKKKDLTQTMGDFEKIGIYFLLAGFVIVGLILLARSRIDGNMFSKKRQDEDLSAGSEIETGLVREEEPFSLARFRSFADNRDRLHYLLVTALRHSARQNNISLRRSVTARELARQLPSSWPALPVLKELIARAEPVLFGDDHISPDELDKLAQSALPLFEGRLAGGART